MPEKALTKSIAEEAADAASTTTGPSPNHQRSDRPAESLDDRRPKFFRDVVGNRPVLGRLTRQVSTGVFPPLAMFIGPTGSGKTTCSRLLARARLCENRQGFESCGICGTCSRGLDGSCSYNEWPGFDLEENWDQWQKHGYHWVRQPNVFFLDEAAHVSERHQQSFLARLEQATGLVIFATTHKQKLLDALVARFGANVYELKRPSTHDCIEHLVELCTLHQLEATPGQIERVAMYYRSDLRKCVDFVFTAAKQTERGVVTDAFLDTVLEPIE